MIISRTPMRMSFAGAGTDLPSFYKRFGGAVVSTAIDKYMYITVNRKFDSAIRASYAKTEEVGHSHQIQHPLIRSVLTLMGIDGGVELASMADIPARGTGLGSSRSFTAGLLHARHAFQHRHASPDNSAPPSCPPRSD